MQAATEQLEQKSSQEFSPILQGVEQRNDINSLRQQIGIVADDSYRNNYMSSVSYQWHKDVTRSDNQDERVTGKLLEEVKDFASKQNQYARIIDGHLQKAVRDKIASESDEKFLLEAFAHQPDFVGKFSQAERAILDKISRMKDDRKAYDQLAHHPLVKNTGFLKLDPNTKIEIPDEKAFLKLTVPERRELLEKAKKALPEAEKYAESHESEEARELEKEYGSLLARAQKKGILGQKTIDKYKDGFKKVDLEEKRHWIAEMKNGHQIERYEELWKNIQKALKGKSLERMESFREKMGYSELLEVFGDEKINQSKGSVKTYQAKLGQARQNKIISTHTEAEFSADISRQTPEDQSRYLEQFDQQMERYQQLRKNIDGLKNKDARQRLDEMYEGAFGYTEIKAKYDRLKSQEGSSLKMATSNSKAEEALAQIQDETIKGAARDAKEELDLGEKKTFVERISRFFNGKGSSQEDVSNYQKNVKKARRVMSGEEAIPTSETDEARESDHITSDTRKIELEEDTETPKTDKKPLDKKGKKIKTPSLQIKTHGSYQQNTFSGSEGEKRVVRVGIGSKKAIQAFNSERNLHQAKDDLSLMASSGNRIVELKVDEIRKFTDYLEHTIDEEE